MILFINSILLAIKLQNVSQFLVMIIVKARLVRMKRVIIYALWDIMTLVILYVSQIHKEICILMMLREIKLYIKNQLVVKELVLYLGKEIY